jgi:hypothetical protein
MVLVLTLIFGHVSTHNARASAIHTVKQPGEDYGADHERSRHRERK